MAAPMDCFSFIHLLPLTQVHNVLATVLGDENANFKKSVKLKPCLQETSEGTQRSLEWEHNVHRGTLEYQLRLRDLMPIIWYR